jgi:hypothetical protein
MAKCAFAHYDAGFRNCLAQFSHMQKQVRCHALRIEFAAAPGKRSQIVICLRDMQNGTTLYLSTMQQPFFRYAAAAFI